MISTLVLAVFTLLMMSSICGARHKINKRQAVINEDLRWTDGEIPYTITAGDFNNEGGKIIRKAMDNWEALTCIKFVPYAAGLGNRARIVIGSRNKEKCYAGLGMFPMKYQPQEVNLGSFCMDVHTVMHELGHAIGLNHEQNRKDRDQYVTVNFQNLKPEKNVREQFQISPHQSSLGVPYSYTSVMHYQKTFFQRGKGYLTIVPKNASYLDKMGARGGLNFVDAEIVTKMYKCNAHCSTKQCPRGAMLGKNCRCWCKSKMYVAIDCETNKVIDTNMLKRRAGGRLIDSPSGMVRFFSSFKVNWFTATEICKRMNGNLLSLNNHQKMVDLVQLIGRNSNFKSKIYWSSGNDINKEGSFEWSDGTAVQNTATFTNGGGNNYDCIVVIIAKERLVQGEYDCGAINRFVCEYEKGSCYDKDPKCKYWARVNKCANPGIANKCRFSCNKCGSIEEENGGGPGGKDENVVSQAPIEVVTQKPQKPSTPTSVRPRDCIRRRCSGSFIGSAAYEALPMNSEFCVECDECRCEVPYIYGFGVYHYFSNVCCAIKQITGKSKGKTTLIRRRRVENFKSGTRNGIRSEKLYRGSHRAFEVKNWKYYNGTPENVAREEHISCLPIEHCKTVLGYITDDTEKYKICISCPPCACSPGSDIVYGFNTYGIESSLCCAIKQQTGDNEEHTIEIGGSEHYLRGGVKNGVVSQYRQFAIKSFRVLY